MTLVVSATACLLSPQDPDSDGLAVKWSLGQHGFISEFDGLPTMQAATDPSFGVSSGSSERNLDCLPARGL
jgi:hypothetical protein